MKDSLTLLKDNIYKKIDRLSSHVASEKDINIRNEKLITLTKMGSRVKMTSYLSHAQTVNRLVNIFMKLEGVK